MPDHSALPSALAANTRFMTLGGVPALVAHPDWTNSAPAMLWMHGRTVNKELDPGRYLRWMRAGIAAVALDLPGHGERANPPLHAAEHTLKVVSGMLGELDGVVASLSQPPLEGLFDVFRLGIGGMSAGGMVTLRRLCDPHPFVCAAVEATCGDLTALYSHAGRSGPGPAPHADAAIAPLDPAQHLNGWRPIPLLALHTKADQWVPFDAQEAFLAKLGEHYREAGADPRTIELRSWETTGAPYEHAGFGAFGTEAKNIQTEFLIRHLRPAT